MWAHIINTSLAVWLMFSPAVFGYEGGLKVSDRIVGPVLVAFSWVAVAQCTRNVRFWNIPFALWLPVAPFVFGAGTAATANGVMIGVAITALSFVRGLRDKPFGGGWRALVLRDPYGVAGRAPSDPPFPDASR